MPQVPSLLYFCIPQNDKLLTYWDTVEDRLYKIRHCLNIEGVFNPPALFAPPIDPMALVRATAAGLATWVGARSDTPKAGSRAAFHCANASAAERGMSRSAAGSGWIGTLGAGADGGIDGPVCFVTTTGGGTGAG